PDAAILSEDTGRSSWQSIKAVVEISRSRGIGRLILVSDPFHSLRIKLMVEELGLRATTSSTGTSPVRGSQALVRHLEEAAGVALGRIIGFEQVEFLTG
ncbi:MAG: YdcF family protein, partial [Actinomycetota bacterium]